MSAGLPSSGPKLPVGGACQERGGFLFAHDCDQPSVAFCASCGKSVCARHLRHAETGDACLACAQAAGVAHQADDPYYYRERYRDYGYYDSSDRRAFSRTGSASSEPSGPLDAS